MIVYYFAEQGWKTCKPYNTSYHYTRGASAQQINRGKTTLFFSKAMPEEKKWEILNFLGVPEIKEYEKYLGLPAIVEKNKKVSLNYIKERVWAKFQG